MGGEIPQNWSQFSNEEKVKYHAGWGDTGSVESAVKEGLKLPEQNQRELLAQAYFNAAERRTRLAAEGFDYSDNTTLAINSVGYVERMKAKGLEYLFGQRALPERTP